MEIGDSAAPIERFPGLTKDQIKEAHAYAYGGSVIQDLGYYRLATKTSANLAHYVRTGDFVLELLAESQNAANMPLRWARSRTMWRTLTPPGCQRAVALHYPKLRAKYGNSVRYARTRRRI